MDEVEYYDNMARSINFTTGDVLLRWIKIDNEKLENYVLRYFFYKGCGGSAIRVTELFLIELSKKYKFNEDELDGLRYVLGLRFGCVILDFINRDILEKRQVFLGS